MPTKAQKRSSSVKKKSTPATDLRTIPFDSFPAMDQQQISRELMLARLSQLSAQYAGDGTLVRLSLAPEICVDGADPSKLPKPLSRAEYEGFGPVSGSSRRGPKYLFMPCELFYSLQSCNLNPHPNDSKSVWCLVQVNRDSYAGADRRVIIWDFLPALGLRRYVETWLRQPGSAVSEFQYYTRLPSQSVPQAKWWRTGSCTACSLQYWLENFVESGKDLSLDVKLSNCPTGFVRGSGALSK